MTINQPAEFVEYKPPTPAEAAPNRMAYHFDEICRLIDLSDSDPSIDKRRLSVFKLKLEDAMVWAHTLKIMSVQP